MDRAFGSRLARAAAVAALLAATAAPGPARAEPTAAERALATTLFRAGRELLAEGRFAEACEKLAESQRLDPGGGTLLNLAICHEQLGKTATAWAELNESLALALREGRADREDIAREHLAALEPRVPRLVIVVKPGTSVPDLVISVDDLVVRGPALGTAVPLDPGRHRVTARAPGYVEIERYVDLADGQTQRVELPGLEPQAAPSPPPVAPPPADTPRPAPTSGHDGQIGIVMRADVDGKARGAAAAVGLSYALGDHVEPLLAAMIGPSFGVWAGATVYVLKGAIKPAVVLGVPTYFVEGIRPGFHGAIGGQWDPARFFGVFVHLGGQAHPWAPAGYERLELVPSAGIQVRL